MTMYLTSSAKIANSSVNQNLMLTLPNRLYQAAREGQRAITDSIKSLPLEIDSPDVVGLPPSVSITRSLKAASEILNDIRCYASQTARDTFSLDMLTSEQVAVIDTYYSMLPEPIPLGTLGSNGFSRDDAYGAVLLHEIQAYNDLLSVMKKSIMDVKLAVSGRLDMSTEIEQVLLALLSSTIPAGWDQMAWLTDKRLYEWMVELKQRVEFIKQWAKSGSQIRRFWLGGLMFPQSLLTSMLQMYSRKTNTPLDKLTLKMRNASPSDEFSIEITGITLEGADWVDGCLCELKETSSRTSMPPIVICPALIDESSSVKTEYDCPLYRTSARASTVKKANYLVSLAVPCGSNTPAHWITRGAAFILC